MLLIYITCLVPLAFEFAVLGSPSVLGNLGPVRESLPAQLLKGTYLVEIDTIDAAPDLTQAQT